MKRFFAATAASTLALALLAAPLASAQQMPQNHDDQKPQPAHAAPQAQRPMPPAQHTQQQADVQRPALQQHAEAPQRPPVQQHAEAQPSGHWQHGQRYTGDRRVVSDWGRYHASPPPAGYEWVQDGNELVLISITSGIIASVLANAVYQ
jgi:Ni/Co efflux regulator RcnB